MTHEIANTIPKSSAAADRGAITPELLAACRAAFEANPAHRMAMNACSRGSVDEIAVNRRKLSQLDWHFSHEVKTGAITAQKNAGFCWLYAALNWLRVDVMAELKLEGFDFSQNHLIFWDRFEKANRFLTAMVAMRDRPTDDRHVDFLLREPCPDGGEWHMVANLIRKYGLVPKSASADTWNLTDSTFLNKVVDRKLRETTARIFAMHRQGASEEAVLEVKRQALVEVYRVLCILMGEPVERFDFAYRDKDGEHHAHRDLTPHTFAERFLGKNLDDYVWIMSSPLADTPFHRTFCVEAFQNVVEGEPPVFLNVPMDELKDLTVRVSKDKQAILFDCDVLQESHRKVGVMDVGVMEYDLLFNTTFQMTRAERMQFLQARMTHCMVILGVDLVNDRPVKWKIENSWGDEVGHKGIFQMSDAWFDEHFYGVVVHKRYLSEPQQAQLTQAPTMLPPWHPLA